MHPNSESAVIKNDTTGARWKDARDKKRKRFQWSLKYSSMHQFYHFGVLSTKFGCDPIFNTRFKSLDTAMDKFGCSSSRPLLLWIDPIRSWTIGPRTENTTVSYIILPIYIYTNKLYPQRKLFYFDNSRCPSQPTHIWTNFGDQSHGPLAGEGGHFSWGQSSEWTVPQKLTAPRHFESQTNTSSNKELYPYIRHTYWSIMNHQY